MENLKQNVYDLQKIVKSLVQKIKALENLVPDYFYVFLVHYEAVLKKIADDIEKTNKTYELNVIENDLKKIHLESLNFKQILKSMKNHSRTTNCLLIVLIVLASCILADLIWDKLSTWHFRGFFVNLIIKL